MTASPVAVGAMARSLLHLAVWFWESDYRSFADMEEACRDSIDLDLVDLLIAELRGFVAALNASYEPGGLLPDEFGSELRRREAEWLAQAVAEEVDRDPSLHYATLWYLVTAVTAVLECLGASAPVTQAFGRAPARAVFCPP